MNQLKRGVFYNYFEKRVVHYPVSRNGQNVSAYVSQTKEQRDAKTPIFYVGNGKTFWSKGETPCAQREQPTQAPQPVTSANDNEPPF